MRNNYTSNTTDTLQPTAFRNIQDYQNYLVTKHYDLVRSTATFIFSRLRHGYPICLDDLIGAGDWAIVKASRSYNPAKGVSFATYAKKAIEHAMYNEPLKLLPVDMKSAWKTDFTCFSFKKVFDDSVFNPGENDNPEYNLSKLQESLHYYCNWDEEEQELRDRLHAALSKLSLEDFNLVKAYYGFTSKSLTLQQLGERYGISPQAVAKRKDRILEKLRNYLDDYYDYRMCA